MTDSPCSIVKPIDTVTLKCLMVENIRRKKQHLLADVRMPYKHDIKITYVYLVNPETSALNLMQTDTNRHHYTVLNVTSERSKEKNSRPTVSLLEFC